MIDIRFFIKAKQLMLMLVLCLGISNVQAALPAAVDGQPLPSLAPMLDRVSDAVVNISTEATVKARARRSPFFDDPFFREFFDRGRSRSQKRQGLGSGVVFDAAKGLILTNAHVINNADVITVNLKDGREAKATVVGMDKASDVAVIKVELDKLNAIPLGNSDSLRVGDFVVAIGNPFGLRQTVTSGIVSALGRSGLGIESYEDFIQTDASINPGNSGGALVNLRGELVGINTAIVAPSGGNVGIGFSIPINMALQVSDQLVQFGKVQRGKLGISMQDVDANIAKAMNLDSANGAIITHVKKGSMAEKAGIKVGDVVVSSNGRSINRSADLRTSIGMLRVGDSLNLDVISQGQVKKIEANIGDVVKDSSVGTDLNSRLKGATFSEISDQQLSRGIQSGVVVESAMQQSSAWHSGLREGDVIVSVNRKPIQGLKDFRVEIAEQDVLLLKIIRGNGRIFLLLQ